MLVPVLGVAAALTLSYLWNEDFFWYLSSGRYLLEHRGFPAQDPFLYTSQTIGWVYHSWLWTVLIAVLDNVAGLGTVVAFHALLACALCVLIFTAGRVDRFGVVNALATTLFLAATGVRLCGKAEVASWLLLAVFYRMLDSERPFDWKRGAALGALQVLWANLHGGYPLGVFVALCYSLGPPLAARLRRRDGAREAAAAGRRPPIWFPLLLFALAVADPWLYRERLTPFAFLADSAAVQPMSESGNVILEWQSPFRAASTSTRPLMFFTLAVAAGLWSFAAARRRPGSRNQLPRLLFFLGLAALGASAVRHLPGLALATALVLLGNFDRGRTQAAPSRSQKKQRAGAPPPGWLYPAVCGLVAGGLLAAAVALRLARPGFEAEPAATFFTVRPGIMAPRAATMILEQALPGPIFNDYLTGAYLGARLHPRARVFVDGRVMDPAVVVRYTRMVQSPEAWQQAEREFGFRTAVLGNYSKTVRSPLGAALMRDPAWRLAHLDPFAVVFVKGAGAPAAAPPRSARPPFLESRALVPPLPALQRLFLDDYPANYLVEYLAILGQFGWAAELVELATRALEAKPVQPLINRQRCAGNLVLRQMPAALADCAVAYRHRPDDPQVVALYVTVLREAGKKGEAVALLERALAKRRDPMLERLRRELQSNR